MQGASDLIVLLESGTGAENLWQPELADGALHVCDLALCWLRGLDPLRRFPANTANHVGVSQGLWSALSGLHAQSGGQGLGYARVKRRSAIGGANEGALLHGAHGAHGGGAIKGLCTSIGEGRHAGECAHLQRWSGSGWAQRRCSRLLTRL